MIVDASFVSSIIGLFLNICMHWRIPLLRSLSPFLPLSPPFSPRLVDNHEDFLQVAADTEEEVQHSEKGEEGGERQVENDKAYTWPKQE